MLLQTIVATAYIRGLVAVQNLAQERICVNFFEAQRITQSLLMVRPSLAVRAKTIVGTPTGHNPLILPFAPELTRRVKLGVANSLVI
jgi:hypothetical protein